MKLSQRWCQPFGFLILIAFSNPVMAQHLWWKADGQKDAKCVYGQITVLATHPNTYFCGINWHPGEAAGGYCGIQQNTGEERRTIFSIWDTSPDLHPTVIAADAKTLHGRFGGEGEGGHTHMLWPWEIGEAFQFYVTKSPGKNDCTETRYYIFDGTAQKWIHSATISSPNGGHDEIANFSSGAMASFLENFGGTDKEAPRLAIYRLWLGDNADDLKPLTHAGGDGQWGTLHDAYFLAAGSRGNLDGIFAKLQKDYGPPTFATKTFKPEPISNRPVDKKVVEALKRLLVAADAN